MQDIVRLLAEHGPIQFMDAAQAKALWIAFRGTHGAMALYAPLLTKPEDNTKFNKTSAIVYGLSLAQSDMSGYNTCRFSTAGCRQGCVSFAGKGELATVQGGRIRRTQFLAEYPDAFCTLLMFEIERVWAKHGSNARVRLNTFSDIPWERVLPEVFERFPAISFYDYSKWNRRPGLPANYTLTWSATEDESDQWVASSVQSGGTSYAVIFDTKRGHDLPVTFMGVKVIDGDKSDDRSSDPHGVIVGLRAKGRMRNGNPMVRKVA